MPQPPIDQQTIQSVLETLPALAVIGLALMALAGLVIWLTGAALAKAACTVSGLALGGLAGWFLGAYLADEGAYIIPLTVGAAIAGALLAALLFRVWVAMVGAVLLALVIPAAILVWQGHSPQPVPTAEAGTADAADGDQPVRVERDEQGMRIVLDVLQQDEPEAEAEDVKAHALAKLSALLDEVQRQAAQWASQSWEALGSQGRMIAMLGGAIGAVLGLVLGLAAPHASAAVQSAVAGSLMMYLGGVAVLRRLLGDSAGFLPDTPRAAIITIGLITVLGVAIQWTVFRKRADK